MVPSDTSLFGALLRQYRLAAGLTQEVLAERAGTSARGLSDLERGIIAAPRADTLQRLADALNLTFDERLVFERTARAMRAATYGPVQGGTPNQEDVNVVDARRGSAHRGRALTAALLKPHPRQRRQLYRSALILVVAAISVSSVLAVRTMAHSAAPRAHLGAPLARWGTVGRPIGLLQSPTSVAVNRHGDVFILDSGYDRVSVFSPSGTPLRAWGSQGRGIGQFRGPSAIAVDAQSNVYVADTGNSRVQKFSASGKPLAHWGSLGFFPGQFEGLDGIAVDSQGLVYAADSGNRRIEIFYPTGKMATALGNQFNSSCPAGNLALGKDGTVYVVDRTANTVNTYSASTRSLQVVAGDDSSSHVSPTSPHAAFLRLETIALDPSGRLYATDPLAHAVRAWNGPEGTVTVWSAARNQIGAVRNPSGVAVGPDRRVYVTDEQNGIVEELSFAGKPLRRFGMPAREWQPMRGPRGIAVGPSGQVYAADTENNRVVRFSPSGSVLSTWGSSGTQPGQFIHPEDITVGRNGRVFVVDHGNHRVQEFSATGVFMRVLRSYGSDRLSQPVGIAVDSSGLVYVADQGTDEIVRFQQNGTFAGRWHIVRDDSGQSLSAFVTPIDVTVDSSSRVYVLDSDGGLHVLAADGTPLPNYRLPTGESAMHPVAVEVGPDNRLYFASGVYNRIDVFSSQWRHLQAINLGRQFQSETQSVNAFASDLQGNLYVADASHNQIRKYPTTS